MAMPKHQPTEESRKSVKSMSAFGIPQYDIADVIGIAAPTLRRHYRQELKTGSIGANAKVVGVLFKLAVEGNVAACIFWTKARMGWSDRGPQPHDGDSPDVIARSIHDMLSKMEERTSGGTV